MRKARTKAMSLSPRAANPARSPAILLFGGNIAGDLAGFAARGDNDIAFVRAFLIRLGLRLRGGSPVILLNGRRIAGFQEIRDLPTEAILRVDILPGSRRSGDR
jgi:hypothetical protein